MPCWAEIDLGSEYQINEVALGNEHFQAYTDRAATELRILKATEPNHWHPVAEHNGAALTESRLFTFAPVTARWVRVEITAGERGMPRLDEIEVYEAEPTPGEFAARRGPRPDPPRAEGQLCQGSQQYRDEAERRLLAHCADGVVFLMFDGTWWNGGCDNPGHGHPVPYRWEDHILAHVDLAQRIHARYPDVLIEMLRTSSTADPRVVDALEEIERRLPSDTFVNSDLALAALALAHRMRPDAAEAIFAVARMAGWTAHALEEFHETRLRFRPEGVYTGVRPTKY